MKRWPAALRPRKIYLLLLALLGSLKMKSRYCIVCCGIASPGQIQAFQKLIESVWDFLKTSRILALCFTPTAELDSSIADSEKGGKRGCGIHPLVQMIWNQKLS